MQPEVGPGEKARNEIYATNFCPGSCYNNDSEIFVSHIRTYEMKT